MASIIGSIDFGETRVPIVIPFALTSVFAIAQLYLGADPLIVLLSMAAILVTFLPLHFNGRDLYSICAIVIGLRWVGAALILKTLYGQPLQTHLREPTASYACMLLLMIIYTSIILLMRRLDPGKELIPFPNDPRSLRRLSIISYCIGMTAFIIFATKLSEGGGFASIFGAILQQFIILAFAAEAIRNIELSGGRGLFGPVLAAMTVLTFIAVSAVNGRGFFVNCLVCIGIIAFMYRTIRFRYIVVGLIFVAFFVSFVTPLTLYLRRERGLPFGQFVEYTQKTAWKAATDPQFLRYIRGVSEGEAAQDMREETNYDYYGDRSNAANRVSFVALFDQVYMLTKNLAPIGMRSVEQSLKRAAPKFLGYYKAPESMGDWLGWQTGLIEDGAQPFVNFGLPMEGYASWRWIGLVSYPFLFFFPFLFIFARIASFRLAVPVSIFIFVSIVEAEMIEQTSDSLISTATKNGPILIFLLFALHFLFFRKRAPLDASPTTAQAARAQ